MTEPTASATAQERIATVLVPTDFSEESFKALRYGAALARRAAAALHVVHVAEIDFAPPGAALPGRNPLVDENEEARALRQQIQEVVGSGITPTFHGRTGRAFDQIVRFARELQADVIVMSTHGRTGLKRLVLGSNAERVVQHSSCPVFIVREKEQDILSGDNAPQLQIRTILVSTDFSESAREGLTYAIRFARHFGARLLLFHAFEVSPLVSGGIHGAVNPQPQIDQMRSAIDAEMRKFTEAADFNGVAFDTKVTIGRAADAICDYAQKENIDMIITSTHGRTGLMHVLIGSVAEHVVRYAHCPVLVVPASIKSSGRAT